MNKEVDLELHLIFTVSTDSEEQGDEDCEYFMNWVRERFTQWDESILQYFLYEYNLTQDGRYTLDLHIDKVIHNDGESETVEDPEPKQVDETSEASELATGEYEEMLSDAQEDEALGVGEDEEPTTGIHPKQSVEVPNPTEQVKRLIKRKREKRREND